MSRMSNPVHAFMYKVTIGSIEADLSVSIYSQQTFPPNAHHSNFPKQNPQKKTPI